MTGLASSTVWVFPTLVGVFPRRICRCRGVAGLPHARGGVSLCPHRPGCIPRSSPRSWGCFYRVAVRLQVSGVFPTLVGVFPSFGYLAAYSCGLPHARGGVSSWNCTASTAHRSSPRSWGCFLARAPDDTASKVFPTLVGVLPRQSPAWGTIRSKWELLHVLCPYSKEINANRTLLKRRKKASYRANFLLIVPMLYRFKKYF